MSSRAPKLEEPIIIAKFWRNRSGEAVIVRLKEFEGRPLIDLRVHVTNSTGQLQPTEKGISCNVRVLPDLAAGVVKALKRAREEGLLPAPKRKPATVASGVHYCDRCSWRVAETIEPTQRGFQFVCDTCPLPDDGDASAEPNPQGEAA